MGLTPEGEAPKSIVLDLDGTLITCRARQVGLAAHLARQVRSTCLDEVAFWRLKQNGATTRGALIQLGWSEADAEALAEAWVASIEAPDWLAQDVLMPDGLVALRYLRSHHVRTLVLTARRDRDAATRQVNDLGITSLIDSLVVVSPTEAAEAKAMHLRQLHPVGFVGDTESDARAASLANVEFVAVANGQRSADFLSRSGVAHVCPNVVSALRLLLP